MSAKESGTKTVNRNIPSDQATADRSMIGFV